MEFHNRIIEHWLLPAKKAQLGWQAPLIPPATGRTVPTRNPQLAEFIEYNWAACPGTGGGWDQIARSLFELPFVVDDSAYTSYQETETETATSKNKGKPLDAISDDLAFIKAAFGLSISQLASVLRVQRPTIYSWFDDEAGPDALRRANRQRLLNLHNLAKRWNAISNQPLKRHLTSTVRGKTSLFELLSAEALNQRAVEKAFNDIAKRIREDQNPNDEPSIAQRLRKKGFANLPGSRRPPKGLG
jgi:hypothetical protein